MNSGSTTATPSRAAQPPAAVDAGGRAAAAGARCGRPAHTGSAGERGAGSGMTVKPPVDAQA